MTTIRILLVPEKDAEDILDPTKSLRSLDDIIKDITDIRDKGDMAVNLDDAKHLEVLGLELIRHSRETAIACY